MKKTLYPKTKRIGNSGIVVTEKLDGSNLGLFKVGGKIIVAQRNNIYSLEEIEKNKQSLYKGLYQWLNENGGILLENLHEGSGVFGEWIGMGKIDYEEKLDKKFYIFAKANLDEEYNLKNMNWNRESLIYPFINMEIPCFMDIVPLVEKSETLMDIDFLDNLYDRYCEKVKRNVEGFIINHNSGIQKYVRMKNGKIEPHKS